MKSRLKKLNKTKVLDISENSQDVEEDNMSLLTINEKEKKTSTQLTTKIHNKKSKKVYTMICGDDDKCLNKDKTVAAKLEKNELRNRIPIYNASEGEKELELFKKNKEDKIMVQNNLKTNKTVLKNQKIYTEIIDEKHLNNDKTGDFYSNKDELKRRISISNTSAGESLYVNHRFDKKKKKRDKKMLQNDDNSTNKIATLKVEKIYDDTCYDYYENDKHLNKDKTKDSNSNKDELTTRIPISNASTDDSLKSRLEKNEKKSKALSSKKVLFITNNVIDEDGGRKKLELFDSRDNRMSKYRTMADTGMSFGQYKNQASNNPNSVQDHENVVSGNTPLQCDFCFKTFIKKSKLYEHKRTHTGEKPYACSICGRSFSQKVNLVRHNRTHNGEKPYTCNFCGQLFSQKENLVVHTRTHTGEKPYACNVCGQSFSRQHHLDRHNKTHHTVKEPYTCKVCDQSFSKKGDFVIHYRTHVGEKPFQCNQCEKKFSTSGNLTRHIQCIHT